jgi:hypothetical protein
LLVITSCYLALQRPAVQTRITHLIAAKLSKQLETTISIRSVDIGLFKRLILNDVLIKDQQSDTLFFSGRIAAEIDSFSIYKKYVAIGNLTLEHNLIKVSSDSTGRYNFRFLALTDTTVSDSGSDWRFLCSKFSFIDARFIYKDAEENNNELTINHAGLEVEQFSMKGDSVMFNIKNLTLDDKKQFFLKNLSAEVVLNTYGVSISNLECQSQYSFLKSPALKLYWNNPEGKKDLNFDFGIAESRISLNDMASLLPEIKGMDQDLSLSGRIYGSFSDLKGKNVMIKTGENTQLQFSFYVNGLSDLENAYLSFDLVKSQTSFADLSKINLPESTGIKRLTFPESFFKAGLLTYTGNFTGFLTDFVAYGTLSSKMGIIKTDLSLIPEQNQNIRLKGLLSTKDFNPAILFNEQWIGSLSMNSHIEGQVNRKTGEWKGKLDGMVDRAEINSYNYNNLVLKGDFDNRHFKGSAEIDDPNLGFIFNGDFDLNNRVPVFNFTLDLQRANLANLKITSGQDSPELSFFMKANFKGKNLDDLTGLIEIENGRFKNNLGSLPLKNISLASFVENSVNRLSFFSDYFDVQITGKYNFQTIMSDFETMVKTFIPDLKIQTGINQPLNIFDFSLNAKNLNSLMTVLNPDLKFETPFLLYGAVNSQKKAVSLEGSLPGLSIGNLVAKNIFLSNKPSGNSFGSKLRIGEIRNGTGLGLYNITLESKIANNQMTNRLLWTNNQDITYSGEIQATTRFSSINPTNNLHAEITGEASKIYIADSIWRVDPFSIAIDSSVIRVNHFMVTNNSQKISINGNLSDNVNDQIVLNLENIDIQKIESYFQNNGVLKGKLNGSLGLADFYGNGLLSSNVVIDNFQFENQMLGKVELVNQWDNQSETLSSSFSITKNDRKTIDLRGNYFPVNDSIFFLANIDHQSLVILETVLGDTFDNIHGEATGKAKIYGKTDNILIDGKVLGGNAGVTIPYTQVNYTFNDSVTFSGNKMIWNAVPIVDNLNNKGIFNGVITHKSFSDMTFNLRFSSPKILALNTTPKDDPVFYGKAFCNGYFTIIGDERNLSMAGNVATLPGTLINISLDEENEVANFDFIKFINQENSINPKEVYTPPGSGGVDLKLTVRATPDAKAQLIYNPKIGDMIRAQGDGVLIFGINKQGNISLSGNYTVTQGDYLFTLQNVINKRFSLARGGTIVWSGDPYNAEVDIQAIYSLKASLYDLLVNEYQNVNGNQRIPVDCKITLTENLSNPNIKFEILFPTIESRMTDELQQYFNTEEELNRQMLSLLVMGKFYTPEYMRGTYEAQNPNIIGNTASELFSNQLSNWLSQISKKVDVGFNYRPGNQITNDEIELALSTQILNDRVSINGNIGNNANPNGNNNSQLVGDFDINVKLTQNGKLALKAYNRSNNNLIYETSPYTQGIGLSVKEEFNSMKEFLLRLGRSFNKKASGK